jgi:hypothetical protein
VLRNDEESSVSIDVGTEFEGNGAAREIRISGPGFDEVVELEDGKGSWRRRIEVPSGQSQIEFALVGPGVDAQHDPRDLQFAFLNTEFGGAFDSPVASWAGDIEPDCAAPSSATAGAATVEAPGDDTT